MNGRATKTKEDPDPEILGDLPLLRASHFTAQGYWPESYRFGSSTIATSNLEQLQRDLYKQENSVDEVVLTSRVVVLTSRHYGKPFRGHKLPYHPDILPNWEAFCNVTVHKPHIDDSDCQERPRKRTALEERVDGEEGIINRTNFSSFRIYNVVLPPSPFFKHHLLPLLNSNANLKSLELRDCNLGDSGVYCIAEFLKKNKSLATLDLSGNTIEDVDAAKSLGKAVKNHSELSFVNLSKCDLVRRGTHTWRGGVLQRIVHTDVLAAIIDGCKGLKSLVLDKNGMQVGDDGAISHVADLIRNNTSLTILSLEANEIGDTNAMILYKAMKSSKLRQLCLSETKIKIPFLVRSKKATKYLTHLDLSGYDSSSGFAAGIYRFLNAIKAEGGKLIASYLKRNPPLIDLSLMGNRINSSAGILIAKSLKKNSNLQYLNLKKNVLTDTCIPAFAKALKRNSTLQTLDISYNNGIKAIVGRKKLRWSIICDPTSLKTVVDSNHTFNLVMNFGNYKNSITFDEELRNINSPKISEAKKIHYKVMLALFGMNTELFCPHTFDELPLELMPRLLDIAQKEIGYNGFGLEELQVVEKKRKRGEVDPFLNRVFQLIKGWNMPLLFNVSLYGQRVDTTFLLFFFLT